MSQPYPLIPPLGWVLDLLNEARKRAKSSGCFGEADYVYMVNKSAQWGWDQRGAANEAELQQARDEELRACELYLAQSPYPSWAKDLRAARRPKPPSLQEQALAELEEIMTELHDETGSAFTASAIRQALERLKGLEAAQ